jgi:hypothetical protein
MHPPTAKQAAREYVTLSDGEHETIRSIGLSLVSLLPEPDAWAVVTYLEQTYLVAINESGFWRVTAKPRPVGTPRVEVELIPLEDCRLSIHDAEDPQGDVYRMYRQWTVTFTRADPSRLQFAANWVRGDRNRAPSRAEQLGSALAEALGWDIAPIPSDFAA